jgi:peroxiredoxin
MLRYFYLVVVVSIVFASPVAISESRFRNVESGVMESVFDHHQKGKWLILMIWASDCSICNSEVQQYVAFHERNQASTAVVLGLTTDGIGKLKTANEFIYRHRVNFKNLIGELHDVIKFYKESTHSDWIGTPSFLVYSPDGSLAVKQAGAVPAELIEKYLQQQDNS